MARYTRQKVWGNEVLYPEDQNGEFDAVQSALNNIENEQLVDGTIQAGKLAGAIPGSKLSDASVTGSKLVDGTVTPQQASSGLKNHRVVVSLRCGKGENSSAARHKAYVPRKEDGTVVSGNVIEIACIFSDNVNPGNPGQTVALKRSRPVWPAGDTVRVASLPAADTVALYTLAQSTDHWGIRIRGAGIASPAVQSGDVLWCEEGIGGSLDQDFTCVIVIDLNY